MKTQEGFDGEKGSASLHPITEIPVLAGLAGGVTLSLHYLCSYFEGNKYCIYSGRIGICTF